LSLYFGKLAAKSCEVAPQGVKSLLEDTNLLFHVLACLRLADVKLLEGRRQLRKLGAKGISTVLMGLKVSV